MKRTVYFIIIAAFVFGSCSQSAKEALKFYEAGNSDMKKGNLINAIINYNKAIALDSTQVEMFMARGNARLTTVDYGGATSDFTKVIQMDPGRAEAYLLRALIKIYKKDFSDDVAVADLNKAILLDPNFARAYYNLGVIQYVRKDNPSACANWRKAADMGLMEAIEKVARYCR
jgi:tetratricopeptide (TPR) repeat protein